MNMLGRSNEEILHLSNDDVFCSHLNTLDGSLFAIMQLASYEDYNIVLSEKPYSHCYFILLLLLLQLLLFSL